MDEQLRLIELPGLPKNELVLSHNRLSTYAMCGKKYDLNYNYPELVIKQPQGAFLGGIAVHEAVAEIELDGDALTIDLEQAQEAFSAVFMTLLEEAQGDIRWGGRGGKENQEWWEEQGPQMVMNFSEIRKLDEQMGWQVLPEFVEAKVGATLDGDVFTGRIDAMVADEDGTLIIRDYKTGVYKRHEQKLQLALYSLLMGETLGLHPVAGELVYLRSNSRVVFTLEPMYDGLRAWWKGAADGIRKEVWSLSPGPMCVSCEVRRSCEYGKTLEEA